MQIIEILYLVFSGTLALAGLSMVGTAIKAYRRTLRTDMIHLSIGFVLIVSASLGTTVSAFISDFQNPRMTLTVNAFIATVGFLFVMYSLASDS